MKTFIILLFSVSTAYAGVVETPESLIMSKLTEYGFLGIIVIFLGWYILSTQKKHEQERKEQDERVVEIAKEHREERDEWRDQMTAQYERTVETVEKSTGLMSELRSTLESIDKNIRDIRGNR